MVDVFITLTVVMVHSSRRVQIQQIIYIKLAVKKNTSYTSMKL